MKVLLVFLTAALTVAVGVVLVFGALAPAVRFAGAGGVGAVAFGAREKFLLGLLAALSTLFVALLAVHRRRGRKQP